MKALTLRDIKKAKNGNLQMLTCYDFQTAQMLNETDLDLILVGDSLGNVMLGYETTVEVTLEEMIIFSRAVRRGAPDKFLVVDMPFGTYSTMSSGMRNATRLFQETRAQALKLEGAYPYQIKLVERLVQNGIPVMGHIGLTPQSVHQLGGYYTHGKNEDSATRLIREAQALEAAGAFSIVLEMVEKNLAEKITEAVSIPTIGIGAGAGTDGQVLVINDLLKEGPNMPPKFCTPIADFFEQKKTLIQSYLDKQRQK
ncbi:MAG TPA: 3-methyl-2-oxobutanoate hydroxymethyltransferase [Bacteriovoracaceae bacterium]|nr:3-methyl-2-oxobutanoate hydroxymethyltransferase [Bacteriovoracaceae bacterium]